jgi:hypothetical protein
VLAVLLVLSGAMVLPFAIPVLSVAKFERYARAVHFGRPDGERDPAELLPRQYAEMFGWPELVRTVNSVAEALSPDERMEAVVLAGNAGRAGALQVFGPAVGLPPVISGSGPFWAWGTDGATGKVVVAVGGDEAFLRAHFHTVEIVTVFGHSLASPAERRVRIYICRDGVLPLDVMWPEFKTDD